MSFSVSDVFRIGIGPSSSHTVGPMLAAGRFLEHAKQHLMSAEKVTVELYGSLALTGIGHATDKAVLLGLMGELPHLVEPHLAAGKVAATQKNGKLLLAGLKEIRFRPELDIHFHRTESLPHHPNGMRFSLFDANRSLIATRCYFSIGGGTVFDEEEMATEQGRDEDENRANPLASGAALLSRCLLDDCDIAAVVWNNEIGYRSAAEARRYLLEIWQTMHDCVERGLNAQGFLPGGLNVRRRASSLFKQAGRGQKGIAGGDFLMMDLVSAFAIAVSEENADGGRVVTAPTNGSAGVIPAVLSYFVRSSEQPDMDATIRFLLTAAGIGMLYKRNASISAAEMGCQGEIGVSSSMAAAGLASVLGGSPQQVVNAAEIAMEHFLGMTCDPLSGLVQVPCIERNSMGAIKAINAARMALMNDGEQRVTLDEVIETMRQTGKDMQIKYKETSLGGLAVNVTGC